MTSVDDCVGEDAGFVASVPVCSKGTSKSERKQRKQRKKHGMGHMQLVAPELPTTLFSHQQQSCFVDHDDAMDFFGDIIDEFEEQQRIEHEDEERRDAEDEQERIDAGFYDSPYVVDPETEMPEGLDDIVAFEPGWDETNPHDGADPQPFLDAPFPQYLFQSRTF